MAVAGMPQWFNLTEINRGTNIDGTHQDGLENVAASGGAGSLFPGTAFTTSSQTLSAGPQSTGPVLVTVNGITYAVPWNTAVALPKWVWDALDTGVWTHS